VTGGGKSGCHGAIRSKATRLASDSHNPFSNHGGRGGGSRTILSNGDVREFLITSILITNTC